VNTLPNIIAAIVAALAADHGAFDLSGSDQVKVGTFDKPPVTARPFAAIVPPALTASTPQGVGPDWYVETYRCEVRLWAPVTRSDTEDRAERWWLFAAEVVQTLDTAHATKDGNALARCRSWRAAAWDPETAGAHVVPGWAHGKITIEFTFLRQSGTGA
jgi:hypothetical protein